MFNKQTLKLKEKLIQDYTNDNHYYKTQNGERYMSINTLFKLLSDNSWQQQWHKNIASQKNITIIEAKKHAKILIQESININNILHLVAEHHLNNDLFYFKQYEINENIILMFNNLKKWLSDNINIVYATESIVYDPRLKLAGIVDCVAEFKNDIYIIDFKNSRKFKTRLDCANLNYFEQLAGYGNMWEYCTGQSIKYGLILAVSWDGQVAPHSTNLSIHLASLRNKINIANQRQLL